MPNRKLTRAELIAVNELLKQHILPGSSAGYVKYQEDWSDAKVAQTIAPDIQATTIGGVRLELFGKLDSAANAAREDNVRIVALEDIVENLVNCFNDYKIRYDKLIDTLALNRVVPTNLKHLKTDHQE